VACFSTAGRIVSSQTEPGCKQRPRAIEHRADFCVCVCLCVFFVGFLFFARFQNARP
jgi:hypothetical protein